MALAVGWPEKGTQKTKLAQTAAGQRKPSWQGIEGGCKKTEEEGWRKREAAPRVIRSSYIIYCDTTLLALSLIEPILSVIAKILMAASPRFFCFKFEKGKKTLNTVSAYNR